MGWQTSVPRPCLVNWDMWALYSGRARDTEGGKMKMELGTGGHAELL